MLALITCSFASSVKAQELLLNRSFESPVVPNLGNNFYANLPNWTLTNISPPQSLPVNLIRPHAGYPDNPQVTPTGGDTQYLDIASASGTISQNVTLAGSGTISISGWFSVRDFQQALSGCNILVRNSGGTIVASVSTSFTAADPIGLWKQASVANIALPAGTYTFEADIPNFANIDLVSLVVTYPPLNITKTSSALSDPVNGTTNPKMIPTGVVAYEIRVGSPSSYTVSANSLVLVDPTPSNASLMVNDIGAGVGPIMFSAGSSTLSIPYSGLSSQTDNVDFSADGGATWTYVPSPGSNGSDPTVTHIRVRPSGAMASSSMFVVTLRYVIG